MNRRKAYIHEYSENQKQDFVRLTTTHRGCFYWVLKKMDITDRDDRNDYLQEMYMYAWMRFHQYQPHPQREFGTWLIDTCLWAVYRYKGKMLRHLKVNRYTDNLPDKVYEDEYTASEEIESLFIAINKLPDNLKLVIDLNIKGLGVKECATFLNVSEHSVQMKMYRAKNMIRREMQFSLKEDFDREKHVANLIEFDKRYKLRKNAKPVFQYDIEGQLVRKWTSIQEVLSYGFHMADQCVKGKQRSCNGFIFTYNELTVEECKAHLKVDFSKLYKPVAQFTIDGAFVKRYDSVSQVKEDGFSPANVMACIKGRRPAHKGYKWTYAESQTHDISGDRLSA